MLDLNGAFALAGADATPDLKGALINVRPTSENAVDLSRNCTWRIHDRCVIAQGMEASQVSPSTEVSFHRLRKRST